MTRKQAASSRSAVKKSTIKPTVKKPTALEALTQEVEHAYAQNDGRVITRARDVLRFELEATDEHLAGLRASTAEVLGKRARIKARIDGLTKVLSKR